MSKKRSLCFVDDDPDELARFKQAMSAEYLVGVGTDPTRALDDLHRVQGGKRVDLWVLDMYYPRQGANTRDELDKLGRAWDAFRRAEIAFQRVLSDLGQNIDGGLKVAHDVKSQGGLSTTPFVFFTRKGSVFDAVTAFEQGALTVVKKPDPRGDFDTANRKEAYDKAMIEDRDSLIRTFNRAITNANFWIRHKAHFQGFIVGSASSLLASAVYGLGVFATIAVWISAVAFFAWLVWRLCTGRQYA